MLKLKTKLSFLLLLAFFVSYSDDFGSKYKPESPTRGEPAAKSRRELSLRECKYFAYRTLEGAFNTADSCCAAYLGVKLTESAYRTFFEGHVDPSPIGLAAVAMLTFKTGTRFFQKQADRIEEKGDDGV